MTSSSLRSTVYPVTLYFTKSFNKGFLRGISVIESLGFVDTDSAARWLKGVRANSEAGKLDYAVTDASFQNYAR